MNSNNQYNMNNNYYFEPSLIEREDSIFLQKTEDQFFDPQWNDGLFEDEFNYPAKNLLYWDEQQEDQDMIMEFIPIS